MGAYKGASCACAGSRRPPRERGRTPSFGSLVDRDGTTAVPTTGVRKLRWTYAAELQHAAYPDIAPVDLDLAPAAAYAKALAAANAMEWALVATDSVAGRIEATATTRVFRFKDDVVIRIRPRAGGSRLDIRSVSRLGNGDLGKNASRIRAFLVHLRELPTHER